MNPEVDVFLSKAKNWQEEMEKLRADRRVEVVSALLHVSEFQRSHNRWI